MTPGSPAGLSLSLIGSNSGPAVATMTVAREGNNTLDVDEGGVTFALSDFTGGGDPSTATGIHITSASTMDPAVIGTFSVPEPASALLAICGGAGLLLRRRRG